MITYNVAICSQCAFAQCRLEQWARIAVGGFTEMYLYEGKGGAESGLELLANKPKWIDDSIHVFDGDFTVEADKPALVDTVCGVWAHALRSQGPDSEQLIRMVNSERDTIFPRRLRVRLQVFCRDRSKGASYFN